MPNKYILTEKMRDELLNTFKAAQELSRECKDTISADYYEMLVKHLTNLNPITKSEYLKNVKKTELAISKVVPKTMSLKQIESWLKKDTSMTNEEKFELYYDEYRRIKKKRKKKGKTLNQMCKELKIDRPKKSS